MKTLILLLASLTFSVAQESPLRFTPEPFQLGKIDQGTSRHVVLQGKNTSKTAVQLESVMSQNVGSAQFQFPTQIAPGAKFQIEFDFHSANLDGPFTHQIILIQKGGAPLVTTIEGNIEAPIRFNQAMLDAGYVSPGTIHQWNLYAWSPTGKKFDLALDSISSTRYSLVSTPVMLNIEDPDNIREGGKVPGLKLTLNATNFGPGPSDPRYKSIREIVGLHSTTWPLATPELLVIGFWK